MALLQLALVASFIFSGFIDAATSEKPPWQPEYIRPTTFNVYETVAANEHFRQMGFVVFRHALSTGQVNHAMSLFWDFFEGLNLGISRRFPSSLTHKRHGGMFGKGLFTGCGAGHSSLLWYLRDLPQIRQIFSGIWDTSDLLVSFDGITAFRKPDSRKERKRWYHMDLQPLRWNGTGLPMVQGLVNFLPMSQDSGGLVLVPGSHQLYDHLAHHVRSSLLEKFLNTGDADHFMDLSGTEKFDEAAILVHLEPGDIVVWDGRTVHCNAPPTRRNITDQLFRAAALVTMAPSWKVAPDILKARREAVCKGVTLTHWPTEFVPVDQPIGGTRSVCSRASDSNPSHLCAAPSSCLFHGPPFLSDNQLELIGLSKAERQEWIREPQSRCPGILYPSKVPAMRSIWSSRVFS